MFIWFSISHRSHHWPWADREPILGGALNRVSSQQCRFDNLSRPHKQYIQVDIIFNYTCTCFILDFQEHVVRTVRKMYLLGAALAGAKKVCFDYLNKDMFLEVQKHVDKYDVYLNIFLMGSIYVIKSTCLRGNSISGQTIFKSAAQKLYDHL